MKFSNSVDDLGFARTSVPSTSPGDAWRTGWLVAVFALGWGIVTALVWSSLVAGAPVGERAETFLADSPLRVWGFPIADAAITAVILVRAYLSLFVGIELATLVSFVPSFLLMLPVGVAHGALVGGVVVGVRAGLRR